MIATVDITHSLKLAKGTFWLMHPVKVQYGLTEETHTSSDVLGPPAPTINYTGALGKANVRFVALTPKSITLPGRCLGSMGAGAQSVTESGGPATVSGTVGLSLCSGTVAMKATLGNPPPKSNIVATGYLASMIASSHAFAMPTIPSIPGGGAQGTPPPPPPAGSSTPTTGTAPSGSLTITASTPKDGTPGVSLNPNFSVTLSAAPPAGVLMIVMPASDLTDISKMILVNPVPAKFDSTNTATGTPSQALQPNTQYQLQVRTAMSMANLSSPPLASITFTTGAS
jgi:hypothetical protein